MIYTLDEVLPTKGQIQVIKNMYVPILQLLHAYTTCTTIAQNEEPARLNRDVALRALWLKSLFSMVLSQFLSQNNLLVLVGFYQNLYHHASNAKFSISHRVYII
jgi:hypothetical protein